MWGEGSVGEGGGMGGRIGWRGEGRGESEPKFEVYMSSVPIMSSVHTIRTIMSFPAGNGTQNNVMDKPVSSGRHRKACVTNPLFPYN